MSWRLARTAPKHDWHTLDAERRLQVRQATNRLRRNRWHVRDSEGHEVELSDAEFAELRADPDWLPGGRDGQ